MPTRWESGDVAVTAPSPKRKGKPSKPTYYAPSGPKSYRAKPTPSTYTPAATSSKPQAPIRVSRAKIRRARKTKDIARAQQTIEKLIRDPETMRAKPKLEAQVQRALKSAKLERPVRKVVIDPGLNERPLKLTSKALHIAPKNAWEIQANFPVPKASKPDRPPPARPRKPPVQKVRRQFKQGKRLLPGLDKTQTKIAATVLKEGIEAGATKKELLAATETGLVESNFTNYTDQALTDLDSLGWRQERTSQYGTENATDVKGGAKRFFQESVSDTGGTRGKGQTAGELAQTIQGSAFPERYDEVKAQAKPIVKAFVKGQRLAGVPGKLKGDFDGSQTMVQKLLGAPVKGDKEPGHSAGGMHDPAVVDAYAQDIGSAGANPAENEPEYSQKTVTRIVKNLRSRGSKIPADFKLGQNWDGEVVDGYEIEFLTAPHGSGPHIHLGAKWTGASTATAVASALPAASAPSSVGGSYSTTEGGSEAGKTGVGAGKTSKKRKVKKQDARERMALLRRIIAEGNPELPDTLSGFTLTQPAERKVTLSL